MQTLREHLKILSEAATDERKAAEYLEARRWGDSPACPRCGSVDVYRMTGRNGRRERHLRWRCRDCERQYSVRTGTVFEETRLPLRFWCHAFWRTCASKKGISALQISRECGIGYRAALFMLNRIRFGMAEKEGAPLLTGTAEADEAYVGGRPRRRNLQTTGLKQGPKGNLAPVLAVVQRGGSVRVRHVPKVTAKTLADFLFANVSLDARLMTDEHSSYRTVGTHFRGGHERVHHSKREYARGDVTTNTIEGFFSLLKRKVYGTHHAISKEHLHRYVAEAAFIYNARKVDDPARVALAVKGCEGKRLLYREPSTAAA
jgi:transposase-like protein